MQSTSNSDLSCAVFGHNLIRSKDDPNQLTCKTCQYVMHLDDGGNFKNFPVHNRHLRSALQQLFLLEHRFRRNFITA